MWLTRIQGTNNKYINNVIIDNAIIMCKQKNISFHPSGFCLWPGQSCWSRGSPFLLASGYLHQAFCWSPVWTLLSGAQGLVCIGFVQVSLTDWGWYGMVYQGSVQFLQRHQSIMLWSVPSVWQSLAGWAVSCAHMVWTATVFSAGWAEDFGVSCDAALRSHLL